MCLQQARRSDCSPKLLKAHAFALAVQASSNSSLMVAMFCSMSFWEATSSVPIDWFYPPMFLIVSPNCRFYPNQTALNECYNENGTVINPYQCMTSPKLKYISKILVASFPNSPTTTGCRLRLASVYASTLQHALACEARRGSPLSRLSHAQNAQIHWWWLPSGYVKIAIEHGHRNSGFSH